MCLPPSFLRRASRAAAALLLIACFLPRAAAAQALYHVLEKGETLYSVAKAYGVKADDIAKANSILDPSRIKAGMRLLIPAPPGGAALPGGDGPDATPAAGSVPDSPATELHKVAKGETLYSIAKAFGVSVDILRSENKLSPSSLLKAGDLLRIPLGGKAQATAAPAAAAAPADPKPAMPDAVKTSVKTVAKSVSWPCSGEVRYLDGKAYGVVIRSKQGESQKALTAGKVSIAGPYRGYGNVVFVLSQGFVYVYGGNDAISVRVGDRVKAGQEIGKVGIDGKLGGPAAYFFVYRNGEAIDPATAPRD